MKQNFFIHFPKPQINFDKMLSNFGKFLYVQLFKFVLCVSVINFSKVYIGESSCCVNIVVSGVAQNVEIHFATPC